MICKKQQNILEKLATFSEYFPNKLALVAFDGGLNVIKQLSFQDFWGKSQSVASRLLDVGLRGKTALLMYENAIEFLPAFIGCIIAKTIAVPIKFPETAYFEKDINLLKTVTINSNARKVLTNSIEYAYLENLEVINTDKIIDTEVNLSNILYNPEDICYLQYTSGSISVPRGVIVNHKNLNAALCTNTFAWNYQESSIALNWAPHTHVYGLICSLLTPLYNGSTVYIMSNKDFIKNPVSWLQGISFTKATHSGCPNFGYELCINQKIDRDINLDLSSWQFAINGGEAVLANTLTNFARKFKNFGFKSNSFCPAYGMSEFAGTISSHNTKKSMVVLNKDRVLMDFNLLEQNYIVSCGSVVGQNDEVKIVDPDTLLKLDDTQEGEIWVSGDALTPGYWENNEETEKIRAKLQNVNDKYYMRTGDLGLMNRGNLFITGRIKELINFYGKKYSPLDVELTARHNLSGLDNACFSIIVDQQEKALLLQEYSGDTKENTLETLCTRICQDVFNQVGLVLSEIILVNKGLIPKTTSGKVQRRLCRERYLEYKLNVLYKYTNRKFDTEGFLQKLIGTLTGQGISKIEKEISLAEYGIDSIRVMQLKSKIEKHFDIHIPLADLFANNTLEQLTNLIKSKIKEAVRKL